MHENFKHPIHTTLYSNKFLLHMEVVINGLQAIVESDRKGWLKLNSRNPKAGVTFDSLFADVNEVLQRHGMEGAIKYWSGEMPLFELKVSSQDDLKKLLRIEGKIKKELASRIAAHMTAQLQSPGESDALSPSVQVRVQPQVYLLIPDYANSGKNILRLVTKQNITTCMSLFGKSSVLDFGALFRAAHTTEDKGSFI